MPEWNHCAILYGFKQWKVLYIVKFAAESRPRRELNMFAQVSSRTVSQAIKRCEILILEKVESFDTMHAALQI